MRHIAIELDFASWRDAARQMLTANLPPDQVIFVERGLDNALLPNLTEAATATIPSTATPRVGREFLDLAQTVACHTDPDHWSLLYRVLWRLTHGEPHLLKVAIDDDVRRL